MLVAWNRFDVEVLISHALLHIGHWKLMMSNQSVIVNVMLRMVVLMVLVLWLIHL